MCKTIIIIKYQTIDEHTVHCAPCILHRENWTES